MPNRWTIHSTSSPTKPIGLSGKVHYTGIIPRPDFIKMSADPVCSKENEGKQVPKEDLLVSSKGELKNVFIYVKEGLDAHSHSLPIPVEPLEWDQKGCVYSPHVAGIRESLLC